MGARRDQGQSGDSQFAGRSVPELPSHPEPGDPPQGGEKPQGGSFAGRTGRLLASNSMDNPGIVQGKFAVEAEECILPNLIPNPASGTLYV